MAGRCPDCGGLMKPLAFSEFCPNDCDRKKAADDLKKALGITEEFFIPKFEDGDFSDEEETPTLADHPFFDLNFDDGTDLKLVDPCAKCGSQDVEPFLNCLIGNMHCISCGHVWYVP